MGALSSLFQSCIQGRKLHRRRAPTTASPESRPCSVPNTQNPPSATQTTTIRIVESVDSISLSEYSCESLPLEGTSPSLKPTHVHGHDHNNNPEKNEHEDEDEDTAVESEAESLNEKADPAFEKEILTPTTTTAAALKHRALPPLPTEDAAPPPPPPSPIIIPINPLSSRKLPEIKTRVIEDIPEATEEEEKAEKPTEQEQERTQRRGHKRTTTWRQSRRKSMLELFTLLQSSNAPASSESGDGSAAPTTSASTASTTGLSLSFSSFRFPLPPTRTPLRLSQLQRHHRQRQRQRPMSSSDHASSAERTRRDMSRPRTGAAPEPKPERDPERYEDVAMPAPLRTKKERRMGTAVFPPMSRALGAMREMAEGPATKQGQPLFC
ncbi:hypothetical protein P175DRAFT_0526317 [Aspergillus ochraceoroseus IBT 24754]|uniref:Uncharacterized protein n=1 Tax=Aspergillus ochraceoroseus IBT 24754 TaxID=1392256 RepID=A0A2T5LNC3_9EURO|nr:uncharacterized protein P175DRAFT_0526317 [Aspergillus ochraceoroseus IBT 24754]PTU17783.1 hypothetical protein P175DRAFT_0526317 [Aspergillus ochraceoroseus IBT 24754]